MWGLKKRKGHGGGGAQRTIQAEITKNHVSLDYEPMAGGGEGDPLGYHRGKRSSLRRNFPPPLIRARGKSWQAEGGADLIPDGLLKTTTHAPTHTHKVGVRQGMSGSKGFNIEISQRRTRFPRGGFLQTHPLSMQKSKAPTRLHWTRPQRHSPRFLSIQSKHPSLALSQFHLPPCYDPCTFLIHSGRGARHE